MSISPQSRRYLIVAVAASVLSAVLLSWQLNKARVPDTSLLAYQGTELTDKRAAPDFTLVDQRGATVALSDFRGQVVVLSILDSKCVDVCPFTAVILRNAAEQLGASSEHVAFLGLNTNPIASSVEDVRQWTELHRLTEIPGWRFLTGPPEALKPVWQDYAIAAEVIVTAQPTGYDAQGSGLGRVIHTAGIYLIDQQGRERWYFSVEADASTIEPMGRLIAQRVRLLLKES